MPLFADLEMLESPPSRPMDARLILVLCTLSLCALCALNGAEAQAQEAQYGGITVPVTYGHSAQG